MTTISRVTATKFAIAINDMRPSWDTPGIRAAIERASTAHRNASDSEILRAAINLAENGQVNTPALLAEHGPWWDTAGPSNARPAWLANRVACIEHPAHNAHDCPLCEADRGPELTPEQRADAAAECRRIANEAMTKAAAERRAITERQNGASQ